MPSTSPIDINPNSTSPPANKHSPTSSTSTSSFSTNSTSPLTPSTLPSNLPTMAFSPLIRTTSREQGGAGVGYFGGAALGRTISGGTGAGAMMGQGGVMGEKNMKGEGVLRRLSMGGFSGFKPNFLSPTTASSNPLVSPSSTPTQNNPAPHQQISTIPPPSAARTLPDPFSGAIHEEDHDHNFESTDSVPGLMRSGMGSPPKDKPRRVSFGWPGFGGGGTAVASGSGTFGGGGGPGSAGGEIVTPPEPQPHHHRAASASFPAASTPISDELGRKVSFAGSMNDPELGSGPGIGKGMSLGLGEDGLRRGRRSTISEGAGGKGRRGVSPMGEHILRGGGHF